MPRLGMLIDLTRCIGCDACTLACKQENGTPVDVFFARVLNVEVGTYPTVKRLYESDDQLEGARAFAEKRKPVWRGR